MFLRIDAQGCERRQERLGLFIGVRVRIPRRNLAPVAQT
jgi:hypothetical protein